MPQDEHQCQQEARDWSQEGAFVSKEQIFVPLLKVEDSQDYCAAPKKSPEQAFVLSSGLTFLSVVLSTWEDLR